MSWDDSDHGFIQFNIICKGIRVKSDTRGGFICTRFASLTLQRREDAANGKPAYQPAYIRYAQANYERGEALCSGTLK
ncbi:hypothetical protein E3B51_14530 [Escherichia coli]|nr:hypothetical protein [Escherichia coli]